MTEPGNISNLIPKGRDWIPRELADLKRQIRRLNGGTNPATYPRLTATRTVAAASLTSHDYFIHSWDSVADNGGGVIVESSGGIYMMTAGLYAITVTLYPGITTATASALIQALVSISEFPNNMTATWRGDDAVSGDTPQASAAMVNYADGSGMSGGIFASLAYNSLPVGLTSVAVSIDVVQVR